MLGQCLGGVFGVRALATEVLHTLWPGRFSRRTAAWLATGVVVALLLPLSPLAFYLMTFWKDAWAAVLMLWFGAVTLRMAREGATGLLVGAALALSAALGMVRHNAVFVIPFCGIALCAAVFPRWPRTAVALAGAPLILCLAANAVIEHGFRVQKVHVESTIMTIDLVGLCKRGPQICHQLPWTESHVRNRAALSDYRAADMGALFWRPDAPVDPSMRLNHPRVRAEYLYAVRHFPLELARWKLEAFATLLGLKRTYYFFHPSIIENPFGLVLNRRFARPRAWLVRITGDVGDHPFWRWLSGVHLVWLVANCLWVAGLLVVGRRARRRELVVFAAVMTMPLGYYLSYLLAAPVEDFRFMYPSTLFVQSATLGALIGVLQKGSSRSAGVRGHVPQTRRRSTT
jgi:hypothetical protein